VRGRVRCEQTARGAQCQANIGKVSGLRAETPAKRSSAKTAKHGGKDFVYGVLFATLLAFGAKRTVNRTAKWFCCCTSDCDYFYDLTGTEGEKSLEIVNLQASAGPCYTQGRAQRTRCQRRFGVPDLYPERVYNDSHDEGYDSA